MTWSPSGSKMTSGRRSFSRTFRAGSSTRGTSRPTAAGGGTCWSPTPTIPDARSCIWPASGRLILDRAKQTVDLILANGTRYSNTGPDGRQIETYRFPRELIVSLDPKTVFPRMEIQRGINELPIPDLLRQADDRRRAGLSPHAEVMALQQKFSFPMANVVFAIIGLALGLSVAREGKIAGFVIGIVVIFGYYILLYLCESLTKGHYLEMHLSRWVPNLLLLPFGIVALIWRARWAEGRKPFGWLDRSATRLKSWWAARQAPAAASGRAAVAAGAGPRRARRPGVLIVVRIPRLTWLSPNILDRYISRIYLRTAAISFAALLGIFYIATFIDRSDKLFKGQATTGMLLQLLALMTPQFIYYVIPIAALLGVLVTFGVLSRTSELSVIKACGVSIYRLAAPLLVLSLVWSGDAVRPRTADHGAGEPPCRRARLDDSRPAAADVQCPEPAVAGRATTAASITTAISIRRSRRSISWRSSSRRLMSGAWPA